jgi:hypothetical protein
MTVGSGRSGLSIWLSGSLFVALLLAAVSGLVHLWRCGHFSPRHSFTAELGAGRRLAIEYRPLPRPAAHLRVCLVLSSPTTGTLQSAVVRRGRLPHTVEFRRLRGGRVWVVVASGGSERTVECALSVRGGQVWYAGCPEGLPGWADSDGGELLARWVLLCDGRPPVYLNWDGRARGTLLAHSPRVRGEAHSLCLRSADSRYRDAAAVPTSHGAVLLSREASGRSEPLAELDSSRRILVDADGYRWLYGPAEDDPVTRSPRPAAR